jgi:hypothetical protein
MIFAILVPISALPLFLLVCFFWGLGDYLFTMLAWFLGALAILLVVYLCNILPPVPFIVLGAIGLFCAPFIGLEVRDKREQQRKLKEQEWWLLWQLERELSAAAETDHCHALPQTGQRKAPGLKGITRPKGSPDARGDQDNSEVRTRDWETQRRAKGS